MSLNDRSSETNASSSAVGGSGMASVSLDGIEPSSERRGAQFKSAMGEVE